MMRRASHLALLLAACAVAASGCSEGEPPAATAPEPPAPAGAQPESSAEQQPDDEEAAAVPTPAAKAAGRRYDALVRAYAPVSDRVNFLVAAETLRADAVESGAGEKLERERFGAVRVEIERMIGPRGILAPARRAVAAVTVNDVDQQHVQDLMLAAIDARVRALRQLEAALAVLADDEATDREVEAIEQAWRENWNESLRHAREATTAMQDARARLALPPALEESIR